MNKPKKRQSKFAWKKTMSSLFLNKALKDWLIASPKTTKFKKIR